MISRIRDASLFAASLAMMAAAVSSMSEPTNFDPLDCEQLIIRDSKGKPAIILDTANGPRIRLRDTGFTEDDEWMIEITASYLEGTRLTMQHPDGRSKAKIELLLDGEPRRPRLLVRDSQGIQRLLLSDYAPTEEPKSFIVRDREGRVIVSD